MFKETSGESSAAQIQAFSDFWHWDKEARQAYDHLALDPAPNAETANLAQALYKFLGKTDILAYLVMMGVRLLELHKVLKPTGSIFLHCDPTASHYLKLLMDSIFGVRNFRNEIIWQRTSAHSGKLKKFGRIHDVILFYTKSKDFKFNRQYVPYDPDYIKKHYRHGEKNSDLTARGISHGESGKPWRGIDPTLSGTHWKYEIKELEEMDRQGKVYFPKTGNRIPRYILHLDSMPGVPLQDIWDDISPINSQAKERLGFDTQTPC